MSESGVMDAIRGVLCRVGKVSPTALITSETRFVEDLGIDSLDLVAVFLGVQDELGVVIDDDDVTALRSVGDLSGYVMSRSDARAA